MTAPHGNNTWAVNCPYFSVFPNLSTNDTYNNYTELISRLQAYFPGTQMLTAEGVCNNIDISELPFWGLKEI